MAKRPVFLPDPASPGMVRVETVEFAWHPGLSAAQKQKSVDELHVSAKTTLKVGAVLEVSSKSRDLLGIDLSAFNLTLGDPKLSVECAFQGSKVFENGGPFRDLFTKTPRDAKRDERLRNSGPLKAFDFEGVVWPLEPKTVFYDWIYLSALRRRTDLSGAVQRYQGFTDIEFNPEKSFNCQARSVALYVSLIQAGFAERVTSSPDAFLKFLRERTPLPSASLKQGQLF